MLECGKCKIQSWCWMKGIDGDCPTAREILDEQDYMKQKYAEEQQELYDWWKSMQ